MPSTSFKKIFFFKLMIDWAPTGHIELRRQNVDGVMMSKHEEPYQVDK